MAKITWWPSAEEIEAATALLRHASKSWAKARLAILAAIRRQPQGSLQVIAGAARTRTKVVARLVETWKADGIGSVAQFGRPRDLGPTILSELKAEIQSLRVQSLIEACDWLADKKRAGVRLSLPTVRAYCRRMGAELPIRRKVPKPMSKRRHHWQWTAKQIAELKACASSLGRRPAALIMAGTTQKTIPQVAQECGVPARRLRMDLKYFIRGRLHQVIRHSPSTDILRAKGIRETFFAWCSRQFDLTGHCPSGAAARAFLHSECDIEMPPRTIYTHLASWRKTRGIPARRHRPKLKYIKSEGLKVVRFGIQQ